MQKIRNCIEVLYGALPSRSATAVSYTHLYDVDFKTSLAKLEKNSDGRITGIIAQSTEDDHFIRYNANKGCLLYTSRCV